MAANGFIELLRLSKRGNKSYAASESEVSRWSGIAFEMMGQYFVAPLGEVAEVIYPPKCTFVPNAQSWVVGLANIRGRLLSVSDLAQYVSGQPAQFSPAQKVLCISHQDHYVGLVVDQVLGIQHFNKKSFFSKAPDLDQGLEEYCQGYFHQHNQQWHVFLFSRLLKNPNYMNASIKFIN
ncbi:chemotaxis protein CheW [Acinetobacter chinensis]|uniref:Chemotaxis protein CheW n=1 Tax=Acinetobacter chinensis TaxID=2004650 RepID=A0ABU3WB09_9GAMM|nr:MULTISPECIES: chemotaxis protein CheW [Acinetobacter]AXY60819.1 purine-binding chemotaxis protein CheW [Acinetobacter sp. WCHAc010052]MDV2467585.1 chemotaxis protein CheW [Acinetobacter chinensis]WOE40865.1 chemotaxis protein CheW [Acinetobacter chinensis]